MTMGPIHHILVPTDFGAASARAVAVAAEIAKTFGARLTVLHVIEELPSTYPCGIPPEIERSAHFRLEETVRRVRGEVPLVEGALRQGLAWFEIAELARDSGADLVVVGSHGHGHGDRFLVGSVAERVIRVCAAPVLTVHAFRFHDRTQAGRELAELLLRSDEQAPAVVAVSRGGAMVGAEVAEAFGVPMQFLLTRALERDSRPCGAVCEDGTVDLDGAVPDFKEQMDRAMAELLREAERLGHRWQDDGKSGTVILVSDAVLEPAAMRVAAKAVRRRGRHRLVIATPVASVSARAALEGEVDGFSAVQVVERAERLPVVYEDVAVPPERSVEDRLATTLEWSRAVQKGP